MTTAERLAQLIHDGACELEQEMFADDKDFLSLPKFSDLDDKERELGTRLLQNLLDANVIRVGPGFTLQDVEDVKL